MSCPSQVVLAASVATVVLSPVLISVPVPRSSHFLFLHIQSGTGDQLQESYSVSRQQNRYPPRDDQTLTKFTSTCGCHRAWWVWPQVLSQRNPLTRTLWTQSWAPRWKSCIANQGSETRIYEVLMILWGSLLFVKSYSQDIGLLVRISGWDDSILLVHLHLLLLFLFFNSLLSFSFLHLFIFPFS